MIQFHFQDIKAIGIKKRAINRWLKKIALAEENKIVELTFIFCSDEYLLSINQQYLNHNTYTDIITFDYSNKERKNLSGDIFISLERIKENSLKYKVSFERELLRVMAHGLLHLMGYKDKGPKDKKKMRFMEEKSLKSFFAKSNLL
jgi:rRNA maturation RNase YbeY